MKRANKTRSKSRVAEDKQPLEHPPDSPDSGNNNPAEANKDSVPKLPAIKTSSNGLVTVNTDGAGKEDTATGVANHGLTNIIPAAEATLTDGAQATGDVRPTASAKSLLSRKPVSTSFTAKHKASISTKGAEEGKIPTVPISKERALEEFVRAHFKQRECSAFVLDPNNSAETETCGCGRSIIWHIERKVPAFDAPRWHSELHSRAEPTSSFGLIDFRGFGSATELTPFIRVDPSTKPGDLWALMAQHWNLPAPKLVISVTGGAKKFDMRNRLMQAFKKGLMHAAASTGAWIITGGMADGVMKYAGEAISDHLLASASSDQRKIIALGIAPWGCVDNSEALVRRKESVQDADGQPKPLIYNLLQCANKNAAVLDHNHTHFVLVDDGSYMKFGTEIPMRSAFENYVTQCSMLSTNANEVSAAVPSSVTKHITTPVVMIVCEGGPNTLETAASAAKLGIPALVIKGSGRIADLIVNAFKQSKPKNNGDSSDLNEAVEQEFVTRLIAMGRLDPAARPGDRATVERSVANLRNLLADRKLITIFELEDQENKDMDKAILTALLKANKFDPATQLSLALTWNRSDIAKQEIFKSENRENWRKLDLEESLFVALRDNRHEFVQLFLDNGIQLANFLTKRRLRDLYAVQSKVYEGSPSQKFIVECLLAEAARRNRRSFCCLRNKISHEDAFDSHYLLNVGELIVELLAGQFHNIYSGPEFIVKELSPDTKPASDPHWDANKPEFESPERELFLWAIIRNRKRLARIFWQMVPDPIGGALTASRILMRLKEEAEKQEESDLVAKLEKQAQYYEKVAGDVLSVCYKASKATALRLLTREQRAWGKMTLFSMAALAGHQNFMQLDCCQAKLAQLWMGRIADYIPMWKIVLTMFCPLFAGSLKFKQLKRDEDECEVDSVLFDGVFRFAENVSQRIDKLCCCCRRSQLDDPRRANEVPLVIAIYDYCTAPVTKYCYRVFAQMAFLSLCTFIVLTDLEPFDIRSLDKPQELIELLIWFWSLAMFFEECRQIVRMESRSWLHRFKEHFKSFFNLLDVFSFLAFVVAVLVRVNVVDADPKIPYSIALLLSYLRFMSNFYVFKTIGPKIIMIQKMLMDLLFFFAILAIFILSFGVAIQALLYPRVPFSTKSLIGMVYAPYWMLHGELFLDKMEGRSPPQNQCIPVDDYRIDSKRSHYDPDWDVCPSEHRKLVPFLAAIYVMLTNVLLMNLLIAMFSYTFTSVQENSAKIWRFYRYFVVYEYFEKPTFVPPFVLINHLWIIVKFIYRLAKGTYYRSAGFKIKLKDDANRRLSAFEKCGLEDYIIQGFRDINEEMQNKLDSAQLRLDQVIEDLEAIKEAIGDMKS